MFQRADGRWVATYKDAKGTWRYIYRKSKDEAKGEASVSGFTSGWSAGFYTLWAPVTDRQ